MNKVILIFAALAVVSIGGVPMGMPDVDEGDDMPFGEIKTFLTRYCANIRKDKSGDEEQDNEIRGWGWDGEGEDYRKKRDLSEDGFDMDVLAAKDGPTLIGYGLGMACAGLFKHELELADVLKSWFDLDEDTVGKRRKRRFVKRSASLTFAKEK